MDCSKLQTIQILCTPSYYKDVLTFEQMQQQPFTDLTELWDRFEIHSNVKGGTGIFGSAYRVKALWGIDEDYYNYYVESLKEL